MNIKELSYSEFQEFAQEHFIGNYRQSINYALLKAEEGYEYEFIGYYDIEGLKAASLILYKKINGVYYGYAPRGFLIDYSNRNLLEKFTKAIIDYYDTKNFAFIKINPEIAISKLNNGKFETNSNYSIVNDLVSLGYKKLKNNMGFESLLPRVNAIVNLENFKPAVLRKNTRNKVRKGIRKGLTMEIAGPEKLDIFYEFIKNKINKDEYYYNDLYNVYNKTEDIDLVLVKIDYKKGLINSQNQYNYELDNNTYLNNKLMNEPYSNIINKKMSSDKVLLAYKNDIAEAAKRLNNVVDTYVAGAIIIKHQNRITIEISGFDKKMSRYSPNYFLYYAILSHYADTYKYADLNGVTGDLSHENKYYGLNRFKLGFNPDVYEYIGEFDLIINKSVYNMLLKSGALADEFNK